MGHTTWFFEEFVLKPYKSDYQLFDDHSAYVFNSYYESVGEKVIRTDRGNLSRPTVAWVYKYRNYVSKALKDFIESLKDKRKINILGKDHLKSLYIVEACINSDKRGKKLI